MKKINLGLIGFGNVGAGVVKIITNRRSFLSSKVGVELNIKRICDKDITSDRGLAVGKDLLTKDPAQVIADPQIDIIIELIGGVHPAKEIISQAIVKGKHVVTANKALLAEHGNELFALALDHSKSIYFEASVGAGIPIIKAIREGLVANKFDSIFGIVNGTSNFILSQMSRENCSFTEALSQAKLKGFAEKDPALDIEGIDSAHKLILLTYLCFGKFASIKDIFIEGISQVSLADVNYAKEMGFEIKLLAVAQRESDELEVRVHPTLVPRNHLLSSVDGVNNAIYVSSDLAGGLLFYGPGAGKYSAASAVVSDIVDLTRDIQAGLFRSVLKIHEDKAIKKVRSIHDSRCRYYIRFMAVDKPGVLAKVSGVLAKYGISIATVTQKDRKKQDAVPIVMITHESKEKSLRQAIQEIDKLGIIKLGSVAMRIEEL